MRRPLFCGACCLVALIALVCCRGPSEQDSRPPDGANIIVTGRVSEKDHNSFEIIIDQLSIQSTSDGISAAFQQQNNPYSTKLNKLQCMYDGMNLPVLDARVMLEGTFRAYESATNPGEFDFDRYYTSMGYLGRVYNTKILKQEGKPGIRERLYELRGYWKARLYRIFPSKEASVMAAILLGEKGEVDEDLKALYERNGIVHILSISGLHITIIGMSIYKLLRRMGVPVGIAAPVGGAALVLYGVMTGFGVSVCRAVGMYLLRMLGHLVHRTYDMLTALGAVGVIMALVHPAWLEHMGYLLSFGSVLGLGLLLPALSAQQDHRPEEQQTGKPRRFWEGRVRRWGAKLGNFIEGLFREGLLAGISITVTTLPIQLWFQYEVSVYSVFLNALILPLMSTVMILGLVVMIVPGTEILGVIEGIILTGYEGLCHVFEALPAALWNPGRPALWQVILYYGLWAVVVGGLAFIKKRRVRRSLQVVVLVGAVGIFLLPSWQGDRVTFLDVGQGDCICVQLSTGEVYLFDCGSSSRNNVGKKVLIPFLKYYGIDVVDGVFASHGDADHTNGLIELLTLAKQEHITIEQLVLPPLDSASAAADFAGLLVAAEEAGVPVYTVAAGEGWGNTAHRVEGADQFWCLHPARTDAYIGENAGSQCFYIVLREKQNQLTLLLTGDVEEPGEQQLTQTLASYGIEQVNILKVAHHGSAYSSTENFLEQVRPQVAVISCGRKNSYGHPHEETINRLQDVGSEILITSEYGAIIVEVKDKIKVNRFGDSY